MTEREPTPSVPTLADVAQRAGVSTATVSRCLNAPDQVGETTRKRVMAAVSELGYAPNFSARALAAGHSNTVGAVVPTIENEVFARGIQAFQEELDHHGKTLLIASSAYQAALEDRQVRALVARGADALLLIGYDRNPALYQFLAARRVPTLVAWSYDAAHPQPAIGFDNCAAMAALARLVLSQGHRHIACLSAPTASNDRTRARVAGIRAALSEAGRDPRDLYCVETAYGLDTGAHALREVMARAPDTTAVMCVNDILALGALHAAKHMGLRVPEDLSITGFDDIDLASLADPALTTVHVPHREMGQQAARFLIEMMTTRQNPTSVCLHTDVRLRDSLGPVPQRA